MMTDIRTAHAPSYYAATAHSEPNRPALFGQTRADICIIGGGFTGLNAALTLAATGRSVMLLEQNRVGWGASGRNGGQLHSGQRRDQDYLETEFGHSAAQKLWRMAEDAKALALGRIKEYDIDCDWTPGLISAAHKSRYVDEEHRYADKLAKAYGYDLVDKLDQGELEAAIGTNVYHGGVRDRGAGHLHPLNFALGLAKACKFRGARIYEATPALTLTDTADGVRITTPHGQIDAKTVLLAGNGYLAGLAPEVERRVMPINNFILASEPLSEKAADALIPGREAVADTRFVVHYWRLTKDRRMLFGGGENYSPNFPKDISGFVRKHMLKIYPQLDDLKIDYAWGGALAVTQNRMPCVRRVRSNVYVAAGFFGHGVAMAGFAGHVTAKAILGDTEQLDVFEKIPTPGFPGGRLFRWPILVLAMSWFALRDRL